MMKSLFVWQKNLYNIYGNFSLDLLFIVHRNISRSDIHRIIDIDLRVKRHFYIWIPWHSLDANIFHFNYANSCKSNLIRFISTKRSFNTVSSGKWYLFENFSSSNSMKLTLGNTGWNYIMFDYIILLIFLLTFLSNLNLYLI